MTLRDILSPNPRLSREEYELAASIGRRRYAVRGALRMARWLALLSVVIFGFRGTSGEGWAQLITLRVGFEVLALIVACSAFVGYTTYALTWRALHRMYARGDGTDGRDSTE
ncbi:MAG TPA: hypothetical protein VNE60_09340 [Gemmatimonadaceae bacterium]|nr:hypothetical protein [Gemmatimonadaceae bacterium]